MSSILNSHFFHTFVGVGHDRHPWRAAGIHLLERTVDGRSWRAAGMDFWNKWHGFLALIVSKRVRAGRGRTAVTGCWGWLLKPTARFHMADCFRTSERAVGTGGGWAAVTGCWGWTFETNGTFSLRLLFQMSVRASRGTLRWNTTTR